MSACPLALVGGSFAAQWLIGYTAWRWIHWLSLPLYVTALAHGIGSGTDTRNTWVLGMYYATACAFSILVLLRVLMLANRSQPRSGLAPEDVAAETGQTKETCPVPPTPKQLRTHLAKNDHAVL